MMFMWGAGGLLMMLMMLVFWVVVIAGRIFRHALARRPRAFDPT